jgi:hypothetical protein
MSTPSIARSPDADAADIHPVDILMNLIITILAPMFLTAADGDIHFARLAAMQTVNAYQARNHADLLAIAQIIGFGLAALGCLGLSMADNLSISMTLRLRGCANALNRSAEQNRRALRHIRASGNPEPLSASGDEAPYAEVAEPMTPPVAMPEPAADAPPLARETSLAVPQQTERQPVPPLPGQQRQALWGAAMANVAAELTADLPRLPPAERRIAAFRASVLSSTANSLLSTPLPHDNRHPDRIPSVPNNAAAKPPVAGSG